MKTEKKERQCQYKMKTITQIHICSLLVCKNRCLEYLFGGSEGSSFTESELNTVGEALQHL